MALKHLQSQLECLAGQVSAAGNKASNEDCIGLRIPEGASLTTKGVAMVIADGVSAASGGQEASHSAVTGLLSDYYSTPDTWSTPRSVQQVVVALNSWLYGRNLNSHTSQLTYLTTMTVVIIKSRVAHIFHIGDCRLYLYRAGELTQLTRDHCAVTRDGSHLTRALGMDHSLDIDYRQWVLAPDDLLLTSSDGIHDWLSEQKLSDLCAVHEADPEGLCRRLLWAAQAAGSDDNLSAQALKVTALALPNHEETYLALSERAFPPLLDPGHRLDGMLIEKELHAS